MRLISPGFRICEFIKEIWGEMLGGPVQSKTRRLSHLVSKATLTERCFITSEQESFGSGSIITCYLWKSKLYLKPDSVKLHSY